MCRSNPGDSVCRALLGRLSTSEPHLQTSHRCLQLWPEHVAMAPYQSHPAFVTAERETAVLPLLRAATPAKPWALSHPSLGQRIPVGSCLAPCHRLGSEPKKSGPVQRESSDLPSREGAGHAQSPPLLLRYRSPPKQDQSPRSFLTVMFSSAQISLFLCLFSPEMMINSCIL